MIFKKKHTLGALGLLILAEIMVAINIVGSKFLVSQLPIFLLLSMRFLLAAIFLLPLHWTQPTGISIPEHFAKLHWRDWRLIIAQALCAGILFNLLMVFGLRYTDAHVAGIITSTLPALIVIGCWLFLKEQMTFKKSICVTLSTLGLIVISFFHPTSKASISAAHFGNFLILASLIPETTYYILTKLPANRLPIFLMSSVINGINALILIPMMLFVIHWQGLHITWLNGVILIIVGFSSGLFYVFWYLGADRVDGVLAALSTAAMPIATVIIAWLALGEKIDMVELCGMGLVVASIVAYAT